MLVVRVAEMVIVVRQRCGRSGRGRHCPALATSAREFSVAARGENVRVEVANADADGGMQVEEGVLRSGREGKWSGRLSPFGTSES